MDIVYLIAAGAFWAAVVALATGCERLQNRKVTP
jgi:hypothetical protein